MCRNCRNIILLFLLSGCATVPKPVVVQSAKPSGDVVSDQQPAQPSEDSERATSQVQPASLQISEDAEDNSASPPESAEQPESPAPATSDSQTTDLQSSPMSGDSNDDISSNADAETAQQLLNSNSSQQPQAVELNVVIDSVYRSYPLLEAALFNRNIAIGQQVGASGAFDLKVKGASENGPEGFYETYRQSIGVVQPTYWGGELFAGYRIGRGSFQPWYLERQTNDAGEFKAGVQVPLARNRNIDARRAELWKAGFERSLAEPDIQAQLIGYVQEASYAYWDWVAAGENHSIATRILNLAAERTSRIEAQVNAGLIDPPELTDNLRLVSIREAKVADTRRKLEQTAAKLSVYLRDSAGQPVLPSEDQLPGFPDPDNVADDRLETDIQQALASRPELRTLDLLRRQIQVDYSEAVNQLQPELNAVLWGSQDMGEPTSSKRDKSPFESEASLYLDVPVQRRKAQGKMTELQGKLAQLSAKRRITADKIRVDVQMAHAALKSAWEQVQSTQDALDRAEDLAIRERQNQEAGASDLLKVSLREQYAVESAEKHVEALRLYFESEADYRAAMALDEINR